ncbi:MAG: hypothetical protein ING91_19415 [Rhodocyclaceae bacterium]|nr:hypothetical protein [Rhodocyclaceae bacterium]MCA3116404.1 hypothetical protein [Rhodocyclaceae bacterium]MCA3129189.1 hypothetical protein [Rhodocyclaceae bacterium]
MRRNVPHRNLTLCLDFDGVLHSYASGWQGAHVIPDPPVKGAMLFLQRVTDLYDVCIYSSRSKSLRGRWAMKCWLREYLTYSLMEGLGIKDAYDEACAIVDQIRWPWFKPAAHLTIDDRAMQFTGEWPSMEAIREFKPWNKP